MSRKNKERKKSIRYRRVIDPRKGKRIENKVYKEALKRGQKAEERVCLCLEELKGKRLIEDFTLFPRYSFRDQRGIDVEIYLSGGVRIPLQIKSSMRGLTEYRQRYGEEIPVIVVNPTITNEEIKESIIEVITTSAL